LGRRLLLKIEDIMHTGREIPKVLPSATLSEALLEMTAKKLGMTAVVNERDRVLGIFTDGDLRRLLERRDVDFHQTAIGEVMTRNCRTVPPTILAVEAVKMMEEEKINALLVVDLDGRLIGALNMHDLLRARVI